MQRQYLFILAEKVYAVTRDCPWPQINTSTVAELLTETMLPVCTRDMQLACLR